ncbi:nucleotidyltransferase domain-containing protein [uncultured Amnibacterium sp.]|uniref:nucleotidyltransferase domain-containing protein n=1 Tax=uncultured Amnibacterium sp. TaxID=1631851 RepID=UPI0035CB0063
MSAGEVLHVLTLLDAAGVEAWVDGGWGVDALLGEQTRPHGDVDLVIPAGRSAEALDALAGAGYAVIRDLAPTAIAVRDDEGREVDLHLVIARPSGGAAQDLRGDPAMADAPPFRYGAPTVGRIAGVAVRCVDVETQLRAHEGYPLRDRDRMDLARLEAAFGGPPRR